MSAVPFFERLPQEAAIHDEVIMEYVIMLKHIIDTFFRVGRYVALILAGVRGIISIIEQVRG